jgi:hypothetical protein
VSVTSGARDRIANPSINFPRSEEEAFQAILHQLRRTLFEGNGSTPGVLSKVYDQDAGLGQQRFLESAVWLNDQQALIRARLEDFIDHLDLEQRRDV